MLSILGSEDKRSRDSLSRKLEIMPSSHPTEGQRTSPEFAKHVLIFEACEVSDALTSWLTDMNKKIPAH
ncbi:hypothetical protein QN277_018034 [Acacia crassicarpa]|uniref:Uncharacterized protein n=1 Tax=Acacia crassicarpa TaxID=499986 RepID=A0AAE1MNT1_9FABA|nr:hypothetical protein QN277_018034 [Acacia crassicarpa]